MLLSRPPLRGRLAASLPLHGGFWPYPGPCTWCLLFIEPTCRTNPESRTRQTLRCAGGTSMPNGVLSQFEHLAP